MRFVLIVLDLVLAACSYWSAFALRFDFQIPSDFWKTFITTVPFVLGARLTAFHFAGLYRVSPRKFGSHDLTTVLRSVVLGSAALVPTIYWLTGFQRFPRSVLILDAFLVITFIVGCRLLLRHVLAVADDPRAITERALIIGAGEAGASIAHQLQSDRRHGLRPVAFLDDDPDKRNTFVNGLPILGRHVALGAVCQDKQIDRILICIPSAGGEQMRSIVEHCKLSGLPFQTVPPLKKILNGELSLDMIREVNIDDLLDREVVRIDLESLRQFYRGKTVLITGAGGSIGSALSKQLARLSPSRLLLLERGENNLFYVDLELRRVAPYVQTVPILADVTNPELIDGVVGRYRPHIIFHAAAHKHVGLMEENPVEAARNNIFGTKIVADAACRHGSESFIFISTDKAVRPTSVMGASKRFAEELVRTYATIASGSTRFAAVRFGNVVGSNGSVFRIFRDQIERGGPVTISHPEAVRFFMTVDEAVQLISFAATMANDDADVFVLNMGEPVQIVDLARSMILLMDRKPDDVPIVFTGLKPGEKLEEELTEPDECIEHTAQDKILKLHGQGRVDKRELELCLAILRQAVDADDDAATILAIKRVVKGYCPSSLYEEALFRAQSQPRRAELITTVLGEAS
jgi:FlaA1/EpsC-like NDP-sugar epimerase